MVVRGISAAAIVFVHGIAYVDFIDTSLYFSYTGRQSRIIDRSSDRMDTDLAYVGNSAEYGVQVFLCCILRAADSCSGCFKTGYFRVTGLEDINRWM